jgi:adiponectin receptor
MAPAFLVDNEYILRGYRINFNTKKKICRSLFLLHNETVNVWSHIIGVFVFIGLMIWSSAFLFASSTYKELMG